MSTIVSVKQKILTLDAGSFQILCDEYLSREGYPNIVSLGTKSGTSKTTKGTPDTYFVTDGGKYVFVEYTTQQDNLIEKIESDNYTKEQKQALENYTDLYCECSSILQETAFTYGMRLGIKILLDALTNN